MRIAATALALVALSSCASTGRAMHEENSLRECGQIVDIQERLACEQAVRDEKWRRDAQARK